MKNSFNKFLQYLYAKVSDAAKTFTESSVNREALSWSLVLILAILYSKYTVSEFNLDLLRLFYAGATPEQIEKLRQSIADLKLMDYLVSLTKQFPKGSKALEDIAKAIEELIKKKQ